jgi:5-methylcytosine-specific restriction endonuclease McrA
LISFGLTFEALKAIIGTMVHRLSLTQAKRRKMEINSIKRPWIKNTSYGNRTKEAFYQTSAWTKCRNAFIQAHPKCVGCGQKATVADHKIRVKDGGAKLDWSNLQAMCAKCHNKKDNNASR